MFILKCVLFFGPFLLKLPYYHQKMKLVLDRFCFYKFYFCYMIMDRCIYLNQEHFVTKDLLPPKAHYRYHGKM